MSQIEDAHDVREAREGDREAFARLVRRHAARVHDLARRMLRDAVEAEDVVQQTFWNAWRALDRFDLARPFRNWLLRIASNQCRNRIAARGRARVLPARGGEDDPPDVAAPRAPSAGGGDRRTAVRDAIEALPEPYRLAVILHYVQGLSLDAVSEISGVGVATLKTHLFRARAALRKALEAGETDAAPGGTTRGTAP